MEARGCGSDLGQGCGDDEVIIGDALESDFGGRISPDDEGPG